MNLLLLEDADFAESPGDAGGPARARVSGARLEHLRGVLGIRPGDRLEVGRLNDRLGTARVLAASESQVELEVTLEHDPPSPLPVTLVLALPRPPMLRRLLEAVAAMGVKRLVLLHTTRVEKSYWQSHLLAPETLRHHLLLGLAQARDTMLPEVLVRRRFRPFVEDELPGWIREGAGYLADPSFETQCPAAGKGPAVLIVGPEGGFVPFEIERLLEAGAQGVGLGRRTLRVEIAVVALLSLLSRRER